MVSRDEDKYVVWPVYFDKSVSKLDGRKVPKKHAVEKPSLENIAKAAKSLAYILFWKKTALILRNTGKKKEDCWLIRKDRKAKC